MGCEDEVDDRNRDDVRGKMAMRMMMMMTMVFDHISTEIKNKQKYHEPQYPSKSYQKYRCRDSILGYKAVSQSEQIDATPE